VELADTSTKLLTLALSIIGIAGTVLAIAFKFMLSKLDEGNKLLSSLDKNVSILSLQISQLEKRIKPVEEKTTTLYTDVELIKREVRSNNGEKRFSNYEED
jgi:uncharacterized protein YoxC